MHIFSLNKVDLTTNFHLKKMFKSNLLLLNPKNVKKHKILIYFYILST